MSKSDFGFLATVFALVVVLVLVLMSPIYFFERATCHNQAYEMNVESKFGMTLGCMVQMESGQWIPINHHRIVEVLGASE